MNERHHMEAFYSVSQLDKHSNQLVIAKLGSILVLDQLSQVAIFTILGQNVQLVVGLPAVVKPKEFVSPQFLSERIVK